MNLPGGFDINSMMKQAQQMQEKMAREMKETTVDAAAGGGAVSDTCRVERSPTQGRGIVKRKTRRHDASGVDVNVGLF